MRTTLSIDEFRVRLDALQAETAAELSRMRQLTARLSARRSETEIDDLRDPERHLFL